MATKFEGQPIVIAGETYQVPRLNNFDFKRLLKAAATLDVQSTPLDQLAFSTDVVHSALARNYPDLTPDDVDKLIDPMQMNEIAEAVMAFTGGKKKAPAPSDSAPSPSTGTDSTPS